PEVGLEEAVMIIIADLREPTVDRNAGVVDPGIETAEVSDGGVGSALEVGAAADVGDDMDGLAAGAGDIVFDGLESFLVASDEDDAGAVFRGGASGGEADAAGRAGDDED